MHLQHHEAGCDLTDLRGRQKEQALRLHVADVDGCFLKHFPCDAFPGGLAVLPVSTEPSDTEFVPSSRGTDRENPTVLILEESPCGNDAICECDDLPPPPLRRSIQCRSFQC
jgi:hypothetical protein